MVAPKKLLSPMPYTQQQLQALPKWPKLRSFGLVWVMHGHHPSLSAYIILLLTHMLVPNFWPFKEAQNPTDACHTVTYRIHRDTRFLGPKPYPLRQFSAEQLLSPEQIRRMDSEVPRLQQLLKVAVFQHGLKEATRKNHGPGTFVYLSILPYPGFLMFFALPRHGQKV